ncbi:unnamed protein product [Microthlaspi erraticum]|uniref:Uncharacterized protein n=1 Tax=Microthlaspi erraticum TaxID=1685480 RepID=A0A6D2JD10_9BRAS|nr:unnamed protein product [Microthlaspi erraticum]
MDFQVESAILEANVISMTHQLAMSIVGDGTIMLDQSGDRRHTSLSDTQTEHKRGGEELLSAKVQIAYAGHAIVQIFSRWHPKSTILCKLFEFPPDHETATSSSSSPSPPKVLVARAQPLMMGSSISRHDIDIYGVHFVPCLVA